MHPFLKVNDRINLHLPRPELAKDMYQAVDAQRDYLAQWLPWAKHTKAIDYTLKYIQEAMETNKDGSKLTTFIYDDKEIAGSIGFVRIDKEKRIGEIGYWLHRNLQGQGIMTQTCQRFIDYAFRTKALNRIEIRVASKNQKSQAIPKRLGFTHEGTLREALLMYNQFYDLELFSLLKREWQTR